MGKDPAFLFYPGDAAQDVSHMNRLERGCYFDIIQAQKKFGRLSEDLIKKVLGHDFDGCWNSLKICLTYVDHMYFIEWLENSIEKRKSYSESRKHNRSVKKTHHMSNICKTYDEHMENEIENEDENIIVIKNTDEIVFEQFRVKYPGSKRGLKTEYTNFIKRHRDHRLVIPVLLPSLNNQIEWRNEMYSVGMFVPEWKALQTWVNQRCWEMEKPEIKVKQLNKNQYGPQKLTQDVFEEQMGLKLE